MQSMSNHLMEKDFHKELELAKTLILQANSTATERLRLNRYISTEDTSYLEMVI